MNGRPMLYLDQYGGKWHACTVRELRQKIGGRVSKMYREKADGQTVHVGYVVGNLWLNAFAPVEIAA